MVMRLITYINGLVIHAVSYTVPCDLPTFPWTSFILKDRLKRNLERRLPSTKILSLPSPISSIQGPVVDMDHTKGQRNRRATVDHLFYHQLWTETFPEWAPLPRDSYCPSDRKDEKTKAQNDCNISV